MQNKDFLYFKLSLDYNKHQNGSSEENGDKHKKKKNVTLEQVLETIEDKNEVTTTEKK